MDVSDLAVGSIVQTGNRRSLLKITRIHNENMVVAETVYVMPSRQSRQLGRLRTYNARDIQGWRAPGQGMLTSYQKQLDKEG